MSVSSNKKYTIAQSNCYTNTGLKILKYSTVSKSKAMMNEYWLTNKIIV